MGKDAADHARAYWATGPYQAELRAERLPPLLPGEVRVRAEYGAVSRGTEAIVARGGVPAGLAEAMRCPFQRGAFPFPVKYGYATVGVIEAGPPERLGERVFALHPHQDRFNLPAEAAHPLPPDLPPERAVLAANMETALNGVWDAGAAAGDRIVVLGAGVVGLLAAWLASRIPATEVRVEEPLAARRRAAQSLGLRTEPGEPGCADLVIEASGAPDALDRAFELGGAEATVVCLGWYADRPVTAALGGAFFQRRQRLIASQVGSVPAQRARRWPPARRLRTALDLLRDPALDRLVTGECRFEDLPRVLPELARAPGATLCHRIRYAQD